jgi:hypothetical protein
MKTFLKVFAVISLSIFAVISFIRFDINMADWGNGGRGVYLFFVIAFSGIVTAVIESDKSSK